MNNLKELMARSTARTLLVDKFEYKKHFVKMICYIQVVFVSTKNKFSIYKQFTGREGGEVGWQTKARNVTASKYSCTTPRKYLD